MAADRPKISLRKRTLPKASTISGAAALRTNEFHSAGRQQTITPETSRVLPLQTEVRDIEMNREERCHCLKTRISVTQACRRHPPNPPINLWRGLSAGGIAHPPASKATTHASRTALELAPNGVLQRRRTQATLCIPTGAVKATTMGSRATTKETRRTLTPNTLPTQQIPLGDPAMT